MAKKPSTAAPAERDEAVEQAKRDSKDTESGVGERLEAARGSLDSGKVFVRETVQELKKVQWPSRRQATMETVVVLSTVAIMTLTVTILDMGLSWATNLLFAR